jgi:hypothetical protein
MLPQSGSVQSKVVGIFKTEGKFAKITIRTGREYLLPEIVKNSSTSK